MGDPFRFAPPMARPLLPLALAALVAAALPLHGQGWSDDARRSPAGARPFVLGTAGLAADLNEQDGASGADFGTTMGVGVRVRTLSFGGEWSELRYGADRKARVFGGFVRAGALGTRTVRPYLVLGLGAYRFTPTAGGGSTVFGGSFGPGATFALGGGRLRAVLEARFHTTFDQYATRTRQELLTAMAGLELGL